MADGAAAASVHCKLQLYRDAAGGGLKVENYRRRRMMMKSKNEFTLAHTTFVFTLRIARDSSLGDG